MNEDIKPNVKIIDDNRKDRKNFLEFFKKKNYNAKAWGNIPILKKELIEKPPPDLIVSDICIEGGEPEIIQSVSEGKINITDLSDISGIKLLTWLRWKFPNIPVIFSSAYWKKELPPLSQHSVCFISKEDFGNPDFAIKNMVSNSYKTIIGVKLHPDLSKNLKKQVKLQTEQVNKSQPLFYFHIINNAKELMQPIEFSEFKKKLEQKYPNDKEKKNGMLFEYVKAWNNRVLGMIEDISGVEEDRLIPVLPFGHTKINKFDNKIKNTIDYMGDKYFTVYLLREYIRAIYGIFFNLEKHLLENEDCIFAKSKYSSNLKAIFKKEKKFCYSCQEKIDTKKIEVSWSKAKANSVNKIIEIAEEESKNL
jgi:CheY-like chemotaxis protein